MNIDFDSLRDPDAPVPGDRQREGVSQRARQLRARSRMNRLALSSVSVVAVVALVFGIVASQRDNGPHVIVAGPSGTSTTAPVVTQSLPAVSASFVSPEHGWALERNGTVAETTDGGSSWHVAGSLDAPKLAARVRFADAQNGFVFDDQGYLAVSSDGGTNWQHAQVPFPYVFDLEIANGTVYVASGSSKGTVDVWTAPVGTSAWTRQETGIPIGAGPIPYTQLVLSGGKGWLLQVDRTVVGGAQLTPSGTWTAWTPPCANAGGAAYLAASSPNDLVASCEEGAYTGPRITNGVYFSHDGGQTFTRHDAPDSGPVATPNATTAVVPGSAGLQHTTDSGATWNGVFDTPLSAVDLGFTTQTQGFVVFSNGDMLMTHDAGATWQKVTLP